MKKNAAIKGATFFLIASFTVLLAITIPKTNAQDEILVYLEPASITVDTGEIFNITICIDKIPADPGVVGVQFKVEWDSSVLTGVGLEEVLFHSTMPNQSEIDANLWRLKHDVQLGHIEYAYTYQNLFRALQEGYAPISGNHTLAVITLNATGTGFTTIEFTTLKIGGPTGQSLSATSTSSEITVGNPPPTITILAPMNAAIYGQSSIDLTFKVSESTSWIGYTVNGQANTTITGNTTLNLADGTHSLVVYATDTTGETGRSDSTYIMVDTTPPQVSFSQSPETPEAELIFGTYKWNITFDASDSFDSLTDIASYNWDFGDGSTGTGKVLQHLFRDPGSYTVTLTATDVVGNSDTSTKTLTLQEPSITFTMPWLLTAEILILIAWIVALGIFLWKTKKK